MINLKQQISYVKSKIREYKEDIEYSQYFGKVDYAKRKLPYYESILKSLEELEILKNEI